jgi:hypothetical protein
MAQVTAQGAVHGAPRRQSHGAPHGATHGAPDGDGEVDAQTVIYRLEEAGRTLLALPQTGYSTKLRTSALDMLCRAIEQEPAAAPETTRLRPAIPSASRITRMDEAFAWVSLIPRDRYVIRRIVGCRALVGPITERHLFSWRRIGKLLGADHKAIQRWHAQGIDMIVAAVNALQRGGGR